MKVNDLKEMGRIGNWSPPKQSGYTKFIYDLNETET